jgi:Family of unknown function (DUF5335)
MSARKLDKSEWQSFFDLVSKMLEGARAEIEVDSLKLGAQIEAEWLPTYGMAYDPHDDIIEIAMEDVDHLIPHPREMYVDTGVEGLISMEIIDQDGVAQIINLREPLMLQPPEHRGSDAARRE